MLEALAAARNEAVLAAADYLEYLVEDPRSARSDFFSRVVHGVDPEFSYYPYPPG
jgi:hypothetical protein